MKTKGITSLSLEYLEKSTKDFVSTVMNFTGLPLPLLLLFNGLKILNCQNFPKYCYQTPVMDTPTSELLATNKTTKSSLANVTT